MDEKRMDEKRTTLRQMIQCPGQFFIDADIFDAHSIDMSESGVRLQLHQPVEIQMRMKMGAYEVDRVAHLVWARQNRDGLMEYGLRFLEDYETEEMAEMAGTQEADEPVYSPS